MNHTVINTRSPIDEVKRQIEVHARLREQQTLILGEPTETARNPLPDNLGRQVLALLRGYDVSIRRLWPDEAFEVGAFVPAVIDEEYMSETRLCRVEYRHDIDRDD